MNSMEQWTGCIRFGQWIALTLFITLSAPVNLSPQIVATIVPHIFIFPRQFSDVLPNRQELRVPVKLHVKYLLISEHGVAQMQRVHLSDGTVDKVSWAL